ncbi:MAG: hypothetical protein COX65_05195 [Elusimicrobia bacterium CG_4_10_14_0_2_um_filter_56_8]|nr:MAG: hypothetical protein AUJ51_07660 [Elusimicrobia bacterium CG1_02_56_21]PJA14726.1 MAG: hypothetical protein COX65_05195 [Elusimicrobia bacterium CG_4_10_14_0_2_um_filter_56_8]
MKKFVKSLIFASFIAAPLCAAARSGVLETVLANTDPALSAAFLQAQEEMPAFTVPAPASIADDRFSNTPAADYLPLNKRTVIEYEYASSEFPGVKTIRMEYLDYSEKDQSARVNMIIFSRNKPQVANFILASGKDGVRSTDSPLYGPRLEIPYPLVYNAVWNEGPDRNRVAALNAKITVPAGTYNGCLKITTRLNGGDSGAGERYYAPGIGLVYEQIISEDRQETLKLTSFQIKYAGMN